jgi:hypothetical protein
MPVRRVIALNHVLLLAILFGCAPASNIGRREDAAHADVATNRGLILTVRPIPAGTRPARLAALTALTAASHAGETDRMPNGTAPEAPGAESVEVVVREDDGKIVSVVQSGGSGLRAGERVVIVPGERARLARES